MEISKSLPDPFPSYPSLYRRLNKLYSAGYVNRAKMLCSGEFYYFLTRKAVEIAFSTEEIKRFTGIVLNRIKEGQQQHEFLISQFMIKFEQDAKKLRIPISYFIREGQYLAEVKIEGTTHKIKPDGVIGLTIKGKLRLFFLEVDRSTERVRSYSKWHTKSFSDKLLRYKALSKKHKQLLNELGGGDFSVLTVCTSAQRMKNLANAANSIDPSRIFAFTHTGLYTDGSISSAKDWSYKKTNLLSAPVFHFPGKDKSLPLLTKSCQK